MVQEPGIEVPRLRALERLGLLDTPEDDRFDRITATAAEWLGTPVSLISFVDCDRQWFMSHHGLDVRETPRAIAFCAIAIESPETLVVEDTCVDPHFRDNPLVTGPPHVRFYAGQPLIDQSGARIGTLNVIDFIPRTLSDRQCELLKDLARWAETEIALSESELLREAAVRATQTKNQFLSRVSHELRTPLNSVLGFAQLAQIEARDEGTEAGEAIEMILQSGRHLLCLIDELLDYARIESGELPLDIGPVEVDRVVTETVATLQPQAAAQGVTMSVSDHEPPAIVAHADHHRLLQVLLNLGSNAIKYNRHEGTVEIGVEPGPDGLVSISVRDTGIGIAPADRQRLFQPFERLGAEQLGIEGTGIGLSLSAALVERMNGTITVRSTPDAGSTFTVVLPAATTECSTTGTALRSI
jgi:two-component system, sensor histidine kinase